MNKINCFDNNNEKYIYIYIKEKNHNFLNHCYTIQSRMTETDFQL